MYIFSIVLLNTQTKPDQLMQRIPEVELMEGETQARAYAHADFHEPHSMFIRLMQQAFGDHPAGRVLDLGCGTADITVRFAKAYPECQLDGIDGSETMLDYGRELIEKHGMNRQIRLVHGYIPGVQLDKHYYDAVISNSLLHHLQDPMVLWDAIKEYAKPEASVFVMDLLRPRDVGQAKNLVEENAGSEPEILKCDFYNSLLAAYSTDEVTDQLDRAGLMHLSIKVVSDRHFVVSGYL
jgi:ubiquinone/menaquinone biosynthesis C-methylase UbiE